jgi:cytosine deaminase
VLGLTGYGLAPGCRADLVLLQARSTIEAIRLRPTRLAVLRGGRVLARCAAQHTQLDLADRPGSTDFSWMG